MRLLFDGYEVMQEQQEMEQRGVSRHEQAEFKEFAADVNSSGGGAGTSPTP